MGNSTSNYFKGFMIQARDPTTNKAVGEFSVASTEGKTVDCFSGTAVSAELIEHN